jgi:mRNA-degrading endonuclease RelE of RelBE toxin-antitoxin system
LFDIKFTDSAKEDIRYFTKAEQTRILLEIETQLRYEPTVATRNRKQLRKTDIATYELRIGSVRVFYNVFDLESVVDVVAIGRKEHNELFVGGKKVTL